MKFPHVPLTSLEDATQNFEKLQSQTILDKLIGAGVASVVFPTSQTATATVVTHGLGWTPRIVTATLFGGAFAANVTFTTSAYTSTQFTINGFSSISLTGTLTALWIAIG